MTDKHRTAASAANEPAGAPLAPTRRRRPIPLAVKCFTVLALVTVSFLVAVWVGIDAQAEMKAATRRLYEDGVQDLRRTTELNAAQTEAGWRALQVIPITRPDRLATLRTDLYEKLLPRVDSHVATVEAEAESEAEQELARRLGDRWQAFKAILLSPTFELTTRTATDEQTNDALSERVTDSLAENRAAVRDLEALAIEQARQSVERVATTYEEARRWSTIVVATALVIGIGSFVGLIRNVVPRVRRYSTFAADVAAGDVTAAIEVTGADELSELGDALQELVARRAGQARYERTLTQLGEALQVTESEDEAHTLLKRHLERSIPGSVATVLNRNNSANRLQATTQLAAGTGLGERLRQCAPRACLAVRFSRPHDQAPDGENLVSCTICSDEGVPSRCEPLVVGGEVIGSVLVQRERLSDPERRAVSDAVVLAAPVLANLRNLALAEHRALTDVLTGLPNQRGSRDTLLRMVAQASRSLQPLAAVLLDLDHFKRINDVHGHDTGDQVLAAVGASLVAAIRASDFVGRYGGEEFLVLLPDTSHEGAVSVAEGLRRALAGIAIRSLDRPVTASFGVAAYPADAGDAAGLLRQADRALYTAKASGRDCVKVVEKQTEKAPTGSPPGSPPAVDVGQELRTAR